jgi:hypothetical protein
MGVKKQVAEKAVENFHSQFNSEQYEEIINAAEEEFRNSASKEEMTTFFQAIHRKLGSVRRSTQTQFGVNVNTGGSFVTLAYQSEFTDGKATEQFVWRIRDDNAFLLRYDVNSPQLITK